MFTYNRNTLSLNGKWKFNPDSYQRCRQQQWWKGEGNDRNFFPCFNMDGLWETKVPSTWKCEFEELTWYAGHAVCAKDFEIESIPEGHEAFLCFDGVIYTAEVYLNGEAVGTHDYGYSPFQFNVTKLIKEQNRLFVLVDNLLSEERVPGVRFDWNNDGGIINEVKIIFVPKTYIENFRTQTVVGNDKATISVDVVLQSTTGVKEEEVTFSIPELNVEEKLTAVIGGMIKSLHELVK